MSAELEYPAWPPGLTDQTALPYAFWRVMHVADGRRSLERLSQAVGGSEAQVKQILGEVRRWIDRAAVREQPLTEDTEKVLRQSLITVVGPMGELMIDDALDDLPEQPTLVALLASLNAQLSEPHSQTLARLLRTRGIA